MFSHLKGRKSIFFDETVNAILSKEGILLSDPAFLDKRRDWENRIVEAVKTGQLSGSYRPPDKYNTPLNIRCQITGDSEAWYKKLKEENAGTTPSSSDQIGTVTNSISISNAPSGQYYREQHSQAPKAERTLQNPNKKDDWFLAIKNMVDEFECEYGRFPNETEAWGRLRENPPSAYGITKGIDRGEDAVFMSDRSLGRAAFGKRWKRYTKRR